MENQCPFCNKELCFYKIRETANVEYFSCASCGCKRKYPKAAAPIGLAQIQKETDAAIKRGWDATQIEWKRMALGVIYEFCLNKQSFTANEFTDVIKNSPIKTTDNRAIGGAIITAKKLKWLKGTGELERRISKNFNAGSYVQVWESLLFTHSEKGRLLEDLSKLEIKNPQTSLF